MRLQVTIGIKNHFWFYSQFPPLSFPFSNVQRLVNVPYQVNQKNVKLLFLPQHLQCVFLSGDHVSLIFWNNFPFIAFIRFFIGFTFGNRSIMPSWVGYIKHHHFNIIHPSRCNSLKLSVSRNFLNFCFT